MSKAAELAALIGSQSALSNRNLIINGAMQVAQRGTSFSSITSNVYPVDRFFVKDTNAASGQATVSQSTTTPDDFKYALKVDVTTADTSLADADQYKIEYRAEGQDVAHLNWGTSAAKTVTLSFWIRSNKTGNTQVAVVNGDNNRSYVAAFTIDAANTWERKELTVEGDTAGTWLTSNDVGLRLRWGSFGSGYQTSSLDQWIGGQRMSRDDSPINFFDSTDNELYLTGVQLEVGEQATPFEHRSFGDELQRCKRYFERWTPDSNSHGITVAHAYSTGQAQLTFPFSEKRAAPTYSVSGNANLRNASGDSATASLISSNAGKQSIFLTYSRGSGLSAGNASMFRLAADGYLDLDAEL